MTEMEKALVNWVKTMGELANNHPMSFHAFVANHGKVMTAEFMEDSELGEERTPKECFKNATLTAMGREGWLYCEGYATFSSLSGFAIHHAWCLNEHGKVVDPTWGHKEEAAYYGICMTSKAIVDHVIDNRVYGISLHKRAVKPSELA